MTNTVSEIQVTSFATSAVSFLSHFLFQFSKKVFYLFVAPTANDFAVSILFLRFAIKDRQNNSNYSAPAVTVVIVVIVQ